MERTLRQVSGVTVGRVPQEAGKASAFAGLPRNLVIALLIGLQLLSQV